MHNLLARCRPRCCLGFLVALIFAGVAVAETSIPISNSSFEDPPLAPDGYTYVLPGWTNPGATVSAFIERITGVTAADGLNYLGLELNGVVYQDLAVTYAANTLYRLRVAAGHRPGWTAPGNVATYALTDNTGSPIVVSASTNAYNIAAGTFAEAPALYVNTAATPALVGRTIRIRLSAGGDGRSQFDRVRLDSGPFSLVTTTNDSGPGSLRQVVLDAVPGDTVLFATNLSGATVLLTGGQIVLDKNLTIDASALPLGFRLDGAQLNRIFNVVGGVVVTLNALTITNGYGDFGGGINNAGTLTLNQSTLAGNVASSSGGAIENNGNLILNRSTLAGNSAAYGGGAIDNNAALTMNQCTLSGNLAPNNGGAIWAGGTVQLNNCTVAGNITTAGTGGGIDRYGSATIVLTNTIVANNSAPTGPNINGLFTGTNNLTGGDPLLAPLGDYGGPTRTMPPLFGSPALDAGSDSITNLLLVDQRGLARRSGARVDLGAVEVQVLIVTNSADAGPGSLREMVGQAPASSAVLFAPALSGQTILLTSGQIYLDRNVSIDGSSLPGGIRLDGNGADRIFWINGGASAVLTALTITNGNGGSYYGGGLINFGTLTLNRCTLVGNTAYIGGGLLNWDQTLTVNQCTFTENSAQDSGGGLFNYVGTLNVIQSTVVGNVSGNAVFDGGGGVQSYAGPLALTNSIVAGNTATLNENVGFFAGVFTGASNFTNGSPLLAPLGHYGGPTPTMPPQAGSPVVDAAAGSLFAIDQRGAPRLLGSAADLGAVEANLVTTAADGVAGSLRSALSNAIPHDWITFAPALSGATLTLTGGQLLLNKSLSIDASALPGGFTLNGNQLSRIFQVNSGATNVLANLTLTRGNGVGATSSGSGGAILNSGTLTLHQCTLSSNAAANTGGAILNQAPLSANGCTFSTNTAPTNGGAVANGAGGSASFTNCTFFHNAHTGGTQGGGALNHAAGATRMTLVHCTIAGNSATGSDGGGGIRNRGPLFTLANCIVGSNTISAGLGADLNNNSTLTMLGVNVVPALANVNAGTVTGSGTNLAFAPLLAAPGHYGGPTQTMPPLAGSPAMDAGLDAVAAGLATDQRGFVRFVGAQVDIGAVEAATTNNAFAHRAVIAGASVTVSGANLNASTEPGEPVHAWNSGGRSVWWTWTATSDGAVTIDTVGSSFDTLLAVYQGASLGALTLVAANDDIGDGSSQSRVTFNVSAGLTYQIAVDGYNGAGGSIVLNLVQTFGSVYGAANGITTLAGRPDTGSADGPGGLAVFNNPFGIVLDRGGNAYVVDQLNHTIRKVTPVGVVTTIAGVAGQFNLTDGVGPNARFFGPAFIAMDSATNLYVSDIGNHSIRKLTPSGTNWVVTTLAGRPWPYPPGNVDGTNFDARFMDPQGIALGGGGNLFVADAATHTIRKLSPSGTNWIVTTIAGQAFQNGTVDGTGTNARFNGPLGLAIDSGGNLFVTERDGRVIRRMTPSGQNWVVTTIAGSGAYGNVDGTNDQARFMQPRGVTVDSMGALFVADGGSATIRKLTPVGLNWVVTTFAGGDPNRYASADGTGGNAWFESPNGVAFDTAGNLYVTDPNSIRKITTAAVVTTLAGVVIGSTSDDDTGVFAGFYRPYGVAVELSGNNVYVSDSENHTIRKITSVGGVSTIAGLVGNPGFADGPGNNARFNLPYGLVVDGAGNIFVADSGNNRIRKVTAAGVVSTWAGSGAWGFGDGLASGAQFKSPSGLALDGSGNLFVADTWNHAIRKITAAGNVSTIAGTGSPGTNDGPGASAQFFLPTALALDKAGNIFVADTDNHTIRRITPAGVVSTIAGTAGVRVDGRLEEVMAPDWTPMSSSGCPVASPWMAPGACMWRTESPARFGNSRRRVTSGW